MWKGFISRDRAALGIMNLIIFVSPPKLEITIYYNAHLSDVGLKIIQFGTDKPHMPFMGNNLNSKLVEVIVL